MGHRAHRGRRRDHGGRVDGRVSRREHHAPPAAPLPARPLPLRHLRRRAARLGERGDAVYFNNPVDYAGGLDGSPASLQLVVGRGMWEDTTRALESTLHFAEVLRSAGIRHELDVWGEEAPHDWPAWRAQLAKHLPRFV
jgi:hypothetical protein